MRVSPMFIQVDGGSENSAKVMVGLCELLIAQGVCSKIVLSPLMVGHTHEDIDARFALIWRRIRAAFVLTMGQYEKAVKQSQKHMLSICLLSPITQNISVIVWTQTLDDMPRE